MREGPTKRTAWIELGDPVCGLPGEVQEENMKETFSKWLPLLITFALILANVAAEFAVAKQGVEEFRNFREGTFRQFSEEIQSGYVTVREYDARMHTIENALQRIEKKIDRLIEQNTVTR